MLYRLRIGKIPDGNTPLVGQAVTARSIATGFSLGAAVSDAQGFVTFQADGHWEPFYLHLSDVPGGDKFWRSDESHASGSFSPKELPFVLRALGDGVVTGYSGLLQVGLVSGGPSVSVAPGAALVSGHPVAFYNFTTLPNTRPQSGTRIDKVVIELYPEGSTSAGGAFTGRADLTILQDVGSSPLSQNVNYYQVALATLTVPAAGAITLTDDRSFSAGGAAVTGASSLASFSTTNGSGEYIAAMDFTLSLPADITYDVNVSASVTQDIGGGMVSQGTFGSFGAGTTPIQFRQPGQVVVDPSGNVYIADTGNSRMVALNSAGAPILTLSGLAGITGVCVDSSYNIYVVGNDPNVAIGGAGFARKYNSSGGLVWTYVAAVPPTEENPGFGYANHCTTDGTSLFIACAGSIPAQPHWLVVIPAATGDSLTISSADLNHPFGVSQTAGVAILWVTDTGTNTVVGTGVNFGIPVGGRGITLDSGGKFWVAFSGGVVRQYTTAGVLVGQITESDPMGVGAGPGDVLWVSNYSVGTVAKYALQPTGNGGIAVAINGTPGSYANLDISGTIQTSTTTTVAGPTSLTIQLAGKANSNTATFRNLVLSARAVPRAV